MTREPATVEEVREAQSVLKEAIDLHEKKDFNGAIEGFKRAVMVAPFDDNHLELFQKKLKDGGYKLEQESVAYMGCAAVHLSELVKELTEEQKQEVPVDEKLSEIFSEWENE
ncbi:hypothetical protein UR09_06630 [Candidatus Nitromaritima sp. SCGC AAA799-A02]|nr:hypothetical protein UR09_06630 [Candidatus Nitromaritima sp. SCGC AAA799-A02]